MPSTITHAYFSMDVYDHLDIKTKEFLIGNKKWLRTTGQGMDPTFFYNLISLKRGKKIREFGIYFQKHKSYEFFETLINYIKYNNYETNPEIMTFLYGQICHYNLDSMCHPYIIYNAGEYKKNDKSTLKYNHLHGENESLIDNYLVALREDMDPWKFNAYNYCFDTREFSKELKEVIDFTYKEVFKATNFSEKYEKSIKDMYLFYKIFRNDPTGLKINFYKFIDLICPKKLLRKKVLSYHMKIKNKVELLNLNKEKWYNPTDKRLKSNDSFIELYIKAMGNAVEMINKINDYIYLDKKINLKKTIKNMSYENGRDCKKQYELKYFKF